MTSWKRFALLNAIWLAVVIAVGVIAHGQVNPERYTMLSACVALTLSVGRFAILAPALTQWVTLSPFGMAGVAIATELIVAAFVAINIDLLQRLPRVGRRLQRYEERHERTLREQPWLRRLAEVGVALYVSTPLPGTGSFGGPLLGRLVGLTPLRMAGSVAVGTVAGCLALAVAATWFHEMLAPLQEAAWFGPVRLAVIVAVVLFMLGLLQRAQADPPEQTAVASPEGDTERRETILK